MKKFVSVALAGVLAASAMTGLIGCTVQGGSNDGGQGGVNTALAQELYTALGDFELMAATFEADVSYSASDAASKLTYMAQNAHLFGAMEVSEDSFNADVFGTASGTYRLEEESAYLLEFVRGDMAYNAQGNWTDAGVTKDDFTALLAEFKKEEGLAFDREEISEQFSTSAAGYADPVALQLFANLPTVLGGTAASVKDGYTLTYDFNQVTGSLLDKAITIVESVKPETTVSEFLGNAMLNELLGSLFNGIAAEDILSLLPEGVGGVLPEPEAGQEVLDYVKALADDREFFAAVTEGTEFPEGIMCFGDITVEMLFAVNDGPAASDVLAQLPVMINAVKENLASYLFAAIVSCSPEDVSGAKVDATVTIHYNAQKTVTGLAIAGSLEGVYEEMAIVGDATITVEFADSASLTDLVGCRYRGYADTLEEGTAFDTASIWVSYDYEDEENGWNYGYQQFDITYTVAIGADNVVTVTVECEELGILASGNVVFEKGMDAYLFEEEEDAHIVCTFTDEHGTHTFMICVQANIRGGDWGASVTGYYCEFSHWIDGIDIYPLDYFISFDFAEVIGIIA